MNLKTSFFALIACVLQTPVANAFVVSPVNHFHSVSTYTNDVSFQPASLVMLKSTEEPSEQEKSNQHDSDLSRVAYVVNLSYDTAASTLYDTFGVYGTVEQVFMPRNKATNKAKGIAFVTMASEEERDAAMKGVNQSDIDGRMVYVDKAKPRGEQDKVEKTKLYIGNISFDTTVEDLEKAFGEFGPVSNIYVPTNRETGEPRGFAFLAMSKENAASAIEKLNGIEFNGREIEVSESLPRGSKVPNRRNEVKIYIGNLSFGTKEETIREMFEDYGPLIDVYVPVDNDTGLGRGFAFVTVVPEQAEKAIGDFDGYELDGRILRVNEAQPKGYSSANAW
jgi:RNA recognition motif-containing protein